ncbi:MAG: S24/S26 family peptidase [Bacteroidales bacterium]|nr:S24/S26 family peptidase [Bacteroidales bacterium]
MNKVTIQNDLMFAEVDRLLRDGHEVVIPTKGNSMLPFIVGEKDTVTLKKMEDVKVGDIVLALVNGKSYVLHRVLEVGSDEIVLMGDGNLKGQERCHKEDIIGTATKISKKKGHSIDCEGVKHQRQARFWRRLLPLRRIILGVYRRTLLKLY